MPTESSNSTKQLLTVATSADGGTLTWVRGQRRIRSKAKPPISKLGDDLLEEILIRLPDPRSACRCKPVCKRWNAMISNPCFNRRFISHNGSKIEAEGEPPLLLPSDDPLSSILSFLPVPDEIRSNFVVWDSFKDLFLCGFRKPKKQNGELSRLFLVCNPFTKKWVALPLAPERLASYNLSQAKLVCKPRKFHNLDLGDGEKFVYSDYRFRVVCVFDPLGWNSKLEVFCSKSRKWKNEAVDIDSGSCDRLYSLNGKLYYENRMTEIAARNPFHLNRPPKAIHGTAFRSRQRHFSHISVSQGALYITQLESETPASGCRCRTLAPRCRRDVFRVWKWEEGGRTWSIRYELLLKTLKSNSGPEAEGLIIYSVLAQHPEKPEFFFLRCSRYRTQDLIFCCNFRTEKLGFFADQIRGNEFRWWVFQPKVTYFPTPIPSYEKLLGMYGGSYSCLIQSRGSTDVVIRRGETDQ